MENLGENKLRTVLVVYNTDYDEELIAVSNADVSAVRESAQAVTKAIDDFGLDAELVGVDGMDLHKLLARLVRNPPDLVFNLCESLSGSTRNEPTMPAVLDTLSIPYTGADSLCLGISLYKEIGKELLQANGVRTPQHVLIRNKNELDSPLDVIFPAFAKLAHEDASIGIEATNVLSDIDDLRLRVSELLCRYQQPVVVERYIAGREVNVTLLERDHELQILPLHEIDFAAMPADRPHIVSYAAKWDENHIDYEGTKPVPMRNVDADLAARIGDVAASAFQALNLRDFGRVDLRIDSDGIPWVIDVNPNCDLSPDAGVARAANCAGISYVNLIGGICRVAWRRHGRTRAARH